MSVWERLFRDDLVGEGVDEKTALKLGYLYDVPDEALMLSPRRAYVPVDMLLQRLSGGGSVTFGWPMPTSFPKSHKGGTFLLEFFEIN